jgi:hypothetical protein
LRHSRLGCRTAATLLRVHFLSEAINIETVGHSGDFSWPHAELPKVIGVANSDPTAPHRPPVLTGISQPRQTEVWVTCASKTFAVISFTLNDILLWVFQNTCRVLVILREKKVLDLFTFCTKHIARLERSSLTPGIFLLWNLFCVIHVNTECYELLRTTRNWTGSLEWWPPPVRRINRNTIIKKWSSNRMTLTGFIWLGIGAAVGLL